MILAVVVKRSHCIIRCFVGVGVMRCAYLLAQILFSGRPFPSVISSIIVERVDMELGALPPTLADCESTSSVFVFGNGNGDIRDQPCVSRKRFLKRLVICLWSGRLLPFPEFSGFSWDGKVQKLPAGLISSEVNAHQMSPSGVPPHWRSRPALKLVDGISL